MQLENTIDQQTDPTFENVKQFSPTKSNNNWSDEPCSLSPTLKITPLQQTNQLKFFQDEKDEIQYVSQEIVEPETGIEVEVKVEPSELIDSNQKPTDIQDIEVGKCGDIAIICTHSERRMVSMCSTCQSFFCEFCFFDRHLTNSHGGDQHIVELSTLIKRNRIRIEEAVDVLSQVWRRLTTISHPDNSRKLYRTQLIKQLQVLQERQRTELYSKMQQDSEGRRNTGQAMNISFSSLKEYRSPNFSDLQIENVPCPPICFTKEEINRIKCDLQECFNLHQQSEDIVRILKTCTASKTDQISLQEIAQIHQQINDFTLQVSSTSHSIQLSLSDKEDKYQALQYGHPITSPDSDINSKLDIDKKSINAHKKKLQTKRASKKKLLKNKRNSSDAFDFNATGLIESNVEDGAATTLVVQGTRCEKSQISVTVEKPIQQEEAQLTGKASRVSKESKTSQKIPEKDKPKIKDKDIVKVDKQKDKIESQKSEESSSVQIQTNIQSFVKSKVESSKESKPNSRHKKSPEETLEPKPIKKRQRSKNKPKSQKKTLRAVEPSDQTKKSVSRHKRQAGAKRTFSQMEHTQDEIQSKRSTRKSGKVSTKKKKESIQKQVEITLPNEDEDQNPTEDQGKQSKPKDNTNTYCSPSEGYSQQESSQPNKSGKGKQLTRMSGNQTNVICKIQNSRCLMFDIQARNVGEAFSSMKVPEFIKAQPSLLLTSAQHMLILGGEDKGQYLGQNTLFNLATHEFVERAPMPESKVQFGCIFFGGHVFVVGGWKEFYISKSEMYSIETDTWRSLPNLNDEREDISLCIVQDRFLCAFGNVTTRGRRFKPDKKGKVEFTFERIDVAQLIATPTLELEQQWELVSVKTDFTEMEKMPSMKYMGCFNNYTNKNHIVIFGGGNKGSQMTSRCFQIDLEKLTLSKSGYLSKADRFSNHLFFKKDDHLYLFGESYLHMFDLRGNCWVKDMALPLNNSIIN